MFIIIDTKNIIVNIGRQRIYTQRTAKTDSIEIRLERTVVKPKIVIGLTTGSVEPKCLKRISLCRQFSYRNPGAVDLGDTLASSTHQDPTTLDRET